jgi:hypothetical protein
MKLHVHQRMARLLQFPCEEASNILIKLQQELLSKS